jgi:N-acetylmuramic acid 6-phosphate etherase
MIATTQPVVIGVDGGGTTTRAVVLGLDGTRRGAGRAGPANLQQAGGASVRANLLAACDAALQAAGANRGAVLAVTLGLAGSDRLRDRDTLDTLLAGVFAQARLTVVNDAVAALVGGLGQRYGLVAIAGTGMLVYGEIASGATARAGGWGYALDPGSGYSLGLAALRAVAQAADGLQATSLTRPVLGALGLREPGELVAWLHAPERAVAEVAALAPLLLRAADEADLAATECVVQAADAVCAAIGAVAAKLAPNGDVLPLVFAGSTLTAGGLYPALLGQAVQARVRGVRLVAARYEAVMGAALLALEAAGHALLAEPAPTPLPLPLGAWPTEWANVLTRNLDQRSTRTLVELMHVEDARAVAALRPCLGAIAAAADAIAARLRGGGRLIYLGAGTSGRLAVIDAAECRPTFDAAPGQVVGVLAGGPAALTESVEGVEDSEAAAEAALRALDVSARDAVVGVSASGRTRFALGALRLAQRRGALTVALVANAPSALDEHAAYVIAPITGPEAVAGSTRLKAGTAHKLALNMLSTATFVRLGRVYDNLMISVAASNAKLRGRRERVVAQAAGVEPAQAQAALAACAGEVKTAVVCLRRGCSPGEARARLAAAQGDLRAVLG